MKIETILNAMIKSHTDYETDWITVPQDWDDFLNRRKRQRNAFRARILRMDAKKDAEIERYKSLADALANPEREAWD